MEEVDVVIAGGGPGGSAAGIYLACAGLKVAILEKETFPRFRIGESMLPHSNDLFREMGVLEKIAGSGNFMPKPGAEFCTADGQRFQRFWFKETLGADYAMAFQVERSKFDKLLLDQAVEKGCTVRQQAPVTRILPDREGVTVEYQHDGLSHEIRGKWFVDATGRDALAGRLLGACKRSTQACKRIATYSHFRGVLRNEGPAAGNITIARLPGGWFWFIPLNAEKTSVGYVRTLEDFKSSELSPEAGFEQVVTRFSGIAERMRHAERIDDFRTTSDYSYCFESFVPHPRVLLAGDAAGFVDPIFSSGVMMALKSGRLAARMITHQKGKALSPRQRRSYTRTVKHMMEVYIRMINAFYDDAAFELFMHPQPVLEIPDAVAAVVGGNTEMPFRLRWRLMAFYFLCKLQRWIPIAPRIDLRPGDECPLPSRS